MRALSNDAAAPPIGSLERPRGARPLVILFTVAFLVRVAAIVLLRSVDQADHGSWLFGYEASSIARSLHEGHGFANTWTRDEAPWSAGSGATAWLSPIYPGLLAALLGAFGGLTHGAALALFLVQSLVSAAACVALDGIGRELGEPRVGRVAAWTFAFLPAAVWSAAHVVWDTALVAGLFAAWLWLALVTVRRGGTWRYAACGVAFGVLLLVNAAPIVAWVGVAWLAWRARASTVIWIRDVGVLSAAAFVVCLPWLVRNERAVGTFALRSNLWIEVDVGNHDGADGRYDRLLHPSHGAAAFQRYRALGEAAYAREAGVRAREWIAAHPASFVALCARRAVSFAVGEAPWADPRREGDLDAGSDPKSWIKWIAYLATGALGAAGAIAAWSRSPRWRPLLVVLVLFPLPYVATHVMERYRHPIEPLLVLTGAWIVVRVLESRERGRLRGA